jgi:hypothetical protein
MTHPHCAARKLLLRGHKPTVQKLQIACGMCPPECIFCDIWQLACLIQSHTPLAIRSRSHSPNRSRASSPSSDVETTLRSLEQQFQKQRTCLASILSICVVEGAEESEGLRLAHDRCLSTVTALLNQRAMLKQMQHFSFEQESPVSPLTPVNSREDGRVLRRENGSCALRDSYFRGRSGSQMEVAV